MCQRMMTGSRRSDDHRTEVMTTMRITIEVSREAASFLSQIHTTGMHERSYTSPRMRYNKFAAECNPL